MVNAGRARCVYRISGYSNGEMVLEISCASSKCFGLDQGVDLSVASDLAGHSSPNTTKRYDRRGEGARHAAAQTIVVPYSAKKSA